MRRLMNASVLSFVVLLLVLSGCSTQKIEVKNGSEGNDISQTTKTDITIFGVSQEALLHKEFGRADYPWSGEILET